MSADSINPTAELEMIANCRGFTAEMRVARSQEAARADADKCIDDAIDALMGAVRSDAELEKEIYAAVKRRLGARS
jgi:dsRNA-specific ribonuclease